jgi:hypothetical protein
MNMKLRDFTTKFILRRAMKDRLPKEILTRRKMGFPVPVGSWLRGEFSHIIDEYLLSERTQARGIFNREFVSDLAARHRTGEDHTERLWGLINFEIWQRRFIDGETGNADCGSRIADCGSRIADCGLKAQAPGFQPLSTQSAIPSPQSAIHNPQSSIPNPKSEIRNPQSLIPNPQSEIRNRWGDFGEGTLAQNRITASGR